MPRKPLSFDDVREIGLKLPDVEESTTYGAPALKVGKSLFTCPAINKSAEPHTIVVRISFEDRDRLLKEQPDVYYVTDHYVNYPSILVRLPRIRRAELRELLGTAWRFVIERAPKPRMKRGGKNSPR
jgi:hypothetical protein